MNLLKYKYVIITMAFLFCQYPSQLYSFTSVSYNTIITSDRPGYSISSRPLAPGLIQIESGYRYSRLQQLNQHTFGEMLIRMGLWTPFELRLGINSYTWSDETTQTVNSGKDDISIGSKIQLLDEINNRFRHWPFTSLVIQTKLPTGDPDTSENVLQPEARLCMTFSFTQLFVTNFNTGYIYASEEGERIHKMITSIKLMLTPLGSLKLFTEYCNKIPYTHTRTVTHIIQAGTSYQVADSIELDIYYEIVIIAKNRQHTGGVGVTAILPWTFNR